MTDTLKLTRSESVIIRRSEPDLLEVEGVWGPGGSPPPKHFHPAQDERFEVIVGTLRAKVDGDERDLRQGEVLEIPRGTPHQMWNPGEAEARASWQTRPAGRTEQWFRAVDAVIGRSEGDPGALDFAPLLSEYDDVFRLAVAPQPLVKPAVGLLGRLGRLLDRRGEEG
jgi:quercetin dioxygenase-like cupin family protein